jgi:hypothetical protein
MPNPGDMVAAYCETCHYVTTWVLMRRLVREYWMCLGCESWRYVS